MSIEELAEELPKPINKKFWKTNSRLVVEPFIEHWGADIADMQLISKFSKEFRFLLCVIDIYFKYTWIISLKGKKGTTITNVFQKVSNESG